MHLSSTFIPRSVSGLLTAGSLWHNISMASAFTYIDVQNYTLQRHDEILRTAQSQGHSLDRGSYIC